MWSNNLSGNLEKCLKLTLHHFLQSILWMNLSSSLQPILTEPSFQSIHFDRNTMIFYQNTDDGQNPLWKQCFMTNFSSAELSTSLSCVIIPYYPILFHIYNRKSNWIFLGLFLTKAMTPLTVIQMVTLWGDVTFLIVLWFQTRYMKDSPKYCGAVVRNTVCYYENYNFWEDVWFEIFWFESNLRIMFVSVSQRFIT